MWPSLPGGGPRVVVSTAAFHARVRGSVPGLGGLKETKLFLPHPRVKASIVGSLRDREVACSASDRQGSIFESCVWRTVSSQSSHHPQEVLLAQFSLYVHKGGLKPDSFHFIYLVSQLVSYAAITRKIVKRGFIIFKLNLIMYSSMSHSVVFVVYAGYLSLHTCQWLVIYVLCDIYIRYKSWRITCYTKHRPTYNSVRAYMCINAQLI